MIAALLHDVIEDTPITYQDMEQLYSCLVRASQHWWKVCQNLISLSFAIKKEAQTENFRKMFMAMVQDIRVVLIKLADRTHT
ncbi:HD domain-containing protein [Candidatus Hoaglandella endobia]|uniref:HD domain-containing protein n=1 Tax=Candidatus Hoaglandella endobia TaxID=1778263 RepID=UPI001E54E6CF|nr:HD domain-containing protein [Candidatus Hoaglandella endobia]